MPSGHRVFNGLTRFYLSWYIEEYGWEIGDHSYGMPAVLEPEMARLTIGRFCSIGPHVTIILGNHRTDTVTTYPFKTLAHFWPAAAEAPEDHDSRGDVGIGHDVWIGANATILSGTLIGPGAVIAANAVVRGEVPAYSIVAGNPAKVVRMRFDEATVARLLAVAWWTWPDARVQAWVPRLMDGDIEAFLAAAEAEPPEG